MIPFFDFIPLLKQTVREAKLLQKALAEIEKSMKGKAKMKRTLGIRKAKQEARRYARKYIIPERKKWKRRAFWHSVISVFSGLLVGFLGARILF